MRADNKRTVNLSGKYRERLVWAVAGAVAESPDAVRVRLFVQQKITRELEDTARGGVGGTCAERERERERENETPRETERTRSHERRREEGGAPWLRRPRRMVTVPPPCKRDKRMKE